MTYILRHRHLLVIIVAAVVIVSGLGSERNTSLMAQTSPLFIVAGAYDSGALIATSVAVADLNGDGYPDVVTTNQCLTSDCQQGGVSVMLGNGDGTLQSAISYHSNGYHPWSLAIGDLNGDGYLDLVVGNFFGGFAVLLGYGNGTFQAPVTYDNTAISLFSVELGDLNGDGIPDLVLACWNGDIQVLLGNGDGSFQPPTIFSSGGQIPIPQKLPTSTATAVWIWWSRTIAPPQ
jgi:hypothetical protein